MKKVKIIAILLAVLAPFIWATWDYFSLETDNFIIISEDVKRVDGDDEKPRDQYRITAQRIRDNEVMIFRNEDVSLYLKWNSADVQGAASLAKNNKTPVSITYYGWRSRYMTWFWNITSINPAT